MINHLRIKHDHVSKNSFSAIDAVKFLNCLLAVIYCLITAPPLLITVISAGLFCSGLFSASLGTFFFYTNVYLSFLLISDKNSDFYFYMLIGIIEYCWKARCNEHLGWRDGSQ